jgi:uncharacterized protein (TIGR03083 family)
MNETIEAIGADRDALVEIGRYLSPSEWQAESGCEGWTVKDLVAHLATLFWAVADPSKLPDTTGLPTESAQEVLVRSRRGLSPQAVLAEYEEVSEIGLQRLAELAEVDLELPLGDFGTYPASALPLAYCFDHFTHIRADLFRPRGPLAGPPPPSDKRHVAATLDWIETALPQQNPAVAEAGLFELLVTGPQARIITFGTGQAMATISSDAWSLVRWITQRGDWEELGVQAAGDEQALSAARKLKVF